MCHPIIFLAGEASISKRQQKKQLKKEMLKEAKALRKAVQKEKQKAIAAVKRKEMDHKVQNMTAEEREAYRQKAHAVSQVDSSEPIQRDLIPFRFN